MSEGVNGKWKNQGRNLGIGALSIPAGLWFVGVGWTQASDSVQGSKRRLSLGDFSADLYLLQ